MSYLLPCFESFPWCYCLTTKLSTEQWLRLWAREFFFKLCSCLDITLAFLIYKIGIDLVPNVWGHPVLSTLKYVKCLGWCLAQGMNLRNFSCCQFAKQLRALPREETSKSTTQPHCLTSSEISQPDHSLTHQPGPRLWMKMSPSWDSHRRGCRIQTISKEEG